MGRFRYIYPTNLPNKKSAIHLSKYINPMGIRHGVMGPKGTWNKAPSCNEQEITRTTYEHHHLVGGFNPFEKY